VALLPQGVRRTPYLPTLTETMKIMRLNDSAEAPALVGATIETPRPASGEVLVRVHAAGVMPTELLWYPTTHTKSGDQRRGAVPGHEFSGVVTALGGGVTGVAEGDEVYGMNDWFTEGATAEFCLTGPEWIAPKPASLTHIEAASLPISTLTAWQGLFDRAHLQKGERILIHGGAGAVGLFTVQLAHKIGAQVITTAASEHFEFVRQLGAQEVIDYRTEHFQKIVKDIDVVFDTVGGSTLRNSWEVLKPGGRLVTIAAESEGTKDPRTVKAFFIVEPNRDQLLEIGKRIDSGDLKTFVAAEIPLEEASAAYTRKLQQTLGRGKVVLAI
jgi:NADPH:quinone reductase-like Zn-dependent oxidoreductase